jgi:hypothetical protein
MSRVITDRKLDLHDVLIDRTSDRSQSQLMLLHNQEIGDDLIIADDQYAQFWLDLFRYAVFSWETDRVSKLKRRMLVRDVRTALTLMGLCRPLRQLYTKALLLYEHFIRFNISLHDLALRCAALKPMALSGIDIGGIVYALYTKELRVFIQMAREPQMMRLRHLLEVTVLRGDLQAALCPLRKAVLNDACQSLVPLHDVIANARFSFNGNKVIHDIDLHEVHCSRARYPLPPLFDLPSELLAIQQNIDLVQGQPHPFVAHPFFTYEWVHEPSGEMRRLVVLCQMARLMDDRVRNLRGRPPTTQNYIQLLCNHGLVVDAPTQNLHRELSLLVGRF